MSLDDIKEYHDEIVDEGEKVLVEMYEEVINEELKDVELKEAEMKEVGLKEAESKEAKSKEVEMKEAETNHDNVHVGGEMHDDVSRTSFL